jgi:hypothetical protein
MMRVRAALTLWNGSTTAVHRDPASAEARGSVTRRRSFAAASRCAIVGEDFSAAIATDAPAVAGRPAFTRFRNNGRVPLICPTCQVAFPNAGSRQLLCMGLFSIILGARMAEARLPNPSPPAAA